MNDEGRLAPPRHRDLFVAKATAFVVPYCLVAVMVAVAYVGGV